MGAMTDNPDNVRMRPLTCCPMVLSLACVVGCASTGGVPEPFPRPATRPPASRPAPIATTGSLPAPAADGYSVSGTALRLRGAPYRNGGADPSGFDCSGFIHYVFGQHGMDVSRTVDGLFRMGAEVSRSDIQAGDLLFFATSSQGPSHVGMAIGTDEFVHAPSSAGVVRVERLSSTYWTARFVAARRLTND